MRNAKSGTERGGLLDYLRPVGVSFTAGLLCCGVLLFLFAVLLSVKDLPHAVIEPMALFALTAGAFFAGFVCAKLCRENGLALGATCGAAMFLVTLFVSLMLSFGGLGAPAVLRAVLAVAGGGTGGVVGVNSRLKLPRITR